MGILLLNIISYIPSKKEKQSHKEYYGIGIDSCNLILEKKKETKIWFSGYPSKNIGLQNYTRRDTISAKKQWNVSNLLA